MSSLVLSQLENVWHPRFQSVMNAAARMTSRYIRITLILSQLLWVKGREQIDFKLSILVYMGLVQLILLMNSFIADASNISNTKMFVIIIIII